MHKIFIILLLAMALSIGISAQSDESTLTIRDDELIAYVRIVDGREEYVGRYGNNEVVYPIPEDKCQNISNDGRYIALLDAGCNTIQIVHLISQTVISETVWQDKSFKCNLNWLPDNRTLSILKDINTFSYHRYDFDGVNLSELPDYTYPYVTYPQLPNWIDSEHDSQIWRSPNPNIILYEYCYSGESIDDIRCSSSTDIAIYDLSQNSIITILDANPDYMRGYRFRYYYPNEIESVTNGMLSWSYDARYLAFGDCEETDTRWLVNCITQVYDLQTDIYIRVPFGELPNIWRRLEWSPDDYLLGIWSSGKQDDDGGYPYDNLTIFTFANINTGTSIMSNRSFDAPNQRLVWSPDNRAIAVWGKERINPGEVFEFTEYPYRGNLILISTTTGEHTVIDTDVTQIITWRYLCDNPAPQDADICGDA